MNSYKYPERNNRNFPKKIIAFDENESNEGSHKSHLIMDDNLIKCFKNISIAYKSGNMIRLSNQLSYLNNITLNNYFDPCSELLSNNILDILMRISFDKSKKFSLKCTLLAMSIIDNLTFEESYGYFQIFYNLGIINSVCNCIFSENLNCILHSLRILLNYSENQKSIAEEILMNYPLDHFIMFILNIKEDDKKLERKVKYYCVCLVCELSFASGDKFTSCFYASVDYLLRCSPLYHKSYNIEKFIFWIVINCIKSDNKCIDQFYNNRNLIDLIISSINSSIHSPNFQLALIIVEKLYQKPDFIIPELNLLNLVSSIALFNPEDFYIIPILCIIKKHLEFSQNLPFVYDQKFIPMLSNIFEISNFTIKIQIILLFCQIIKNSPAELLPCLIYEHIIQRICETYTSNDINLKYILLNSLIKMLNSINDFDYESRAIFLSEFENVDFSIFYEDQELQCDDQINQMISYINQFYVNIQSLKVVNN